MAASFHVGFDFPQPIQPIQSLFFGIGLGDLLQGADGFAAGDDVGGGILDGLDDQDVLESFVQVLMKLTDAFADVLQFFIEVHDPVHIPLGDVAEER